MSVTSQLAITLIEQSQSQKEVTANAAITDLDQSTGWVQISVASGDVTLTVDQSQWGFIDLTGAPGATRTVTQHLTVLKRTFFRNSTTGGQIINVKMSGGTSFAVPVGGIVLLLSTGSAARFHSDMVPLAGATAASAGTSAELSRVDHRHPRDVVPIALNTDLLTLTNLAAAKTELNGQTHRRTRYDLTQFTSARVLTRVETVGVAGTEVRVEYSTDESTWAYLDNTAGPASSLASTGVQTAGYVSLTGAAKADVYLRAVTINGDGAADPVVGYVVLEAK
jgi:hypothetical protein